MLLRLDWQKGKASYNEELNIKYNTSYVILMKLNKLHRLKVDGVVSHPAIEVVRMKNPDNIETIFGLVDFFQKQAAAEKAKREASDK